MNSLTFIDRETFLRTPYNSDRWGYTSIVIEKARSIEGAQRVLELGPGPMNRGIVDGSDTMGISNFKPLKGLEGRLTIKHDACQTPWPIADKAYDLFLALQVFEHLDGRQREAFAEAKRVARHIILTMPYQCRSERHRLNHSHYLKWFGIPTEVGLIEKRKCPKVMLYFDVDGTNIKA